MRKLFFLLFVFGLTAITLSCFSPVDAAASDTFQITITLENIDLSLLDKDNNAYGTWAVGTVALSSVSTMTADNGGSNEEGIHVDNSSTIGIDLECYSASNTHSWTLGATPSNNQCVLRGKSFNAWVANDPPDMSSAVTITKTGAPGDDLEVNIGAATDKYLYFDFTAPSGATTYTENTFTVTILGTSS